MPGPTHRGDYRRFRIVLPDGRRSTVSLPGYLVDAATRMLGDVGLRAWVRGQAGGSYEIASRLFRLLIEHARQGELFPAENRAQMR